MLKNKKILLIAPIFYDYEKEIMEEIRSRQCGVDFIPLQEKNSKKNLLLKILKKFLPSIEDFFYEKIYWKKKIKENNSKYDFILVISGETLSNNIVKELNKKLFENGKSILYIWTPISRYKNLIETLKYYGEVFSFEEKDCQKYNLKFRPTFYSKKLEKIKLNQNKIKFNYSFVGMLRPARYCFLKKIKKYGNGKIFLYMNPIVFFIFKLLKKEYRSIEYKDISFKTLQRDKMYELFLSSKCIIDDADTSQDGLTQRIFDSLLLEKKVITTNKSIKKYDFYNENNFCIVDRETPVIAKDFYETNYKKIDPKIIEYYSIKTWINEILGV